MNDSYIYYIKSCQNKLIFIIDHNKKVMRKVAAQEISSLDELQGIYLNVTSEENFLAYPCYGI